MVDGSHKHGAAPVHPTMSEKLALSERRQARGQGTDNGRLARAIHCKTELQYALAVNLRGYSAASCRCWSLRRNGVFGRTADA